MRRMRAPGAGKDEASVLGPSRDIEMLLAIMAALRDKENGCPWDVAQSFASIAPYTIEEAYEVADAIAQGDMGELREELGDLLLQVVFHAQMGREAGLFDFGDVVAAITEKLIRRHPHVFGATRGAKLEEVNAAWERIKREEKVAQEHGHPSAATASLLDGVPLALPALTRAEKLQSRAARVGFDWKTPQPILAKLREELAECEAALEAGNESGGHGRDRRSPVHRRQSRAPCRRRSGSGGAWREREIRAPVSRHGGRCHRLGARHENDEPRRARGALGRPRS